MDTETQEAPRSAPDELQEPLVDDETVIALATLIMPHDRRLAILSPDLLEQIAATQINGVRTMLMLVMYEPEWIAQLAQLARRRVRDTECNSECGPDEHEEGAAHAMRGYVLGTALMADLARTSVHRPHEGCGGPACPAIVAGRERANAAAQELSRIISEHGLTERMRAMLTGIEVHAEQTTREITNEERLAALGMEPGS